MFDLFWIRLCNFNIEVKGYYVKNKNQVLKLAAYFRFIYVLSTSLIILLFMVYIHLPFFNWKN